jgi:DNA repair protein RecN (Recombination protein N)
MLRHITVRDFAIIDNLEVEVGPGMTALTGETGAGKSILIDVIGLLLGDRADAASVRAGADQADLSAGFELSPDHPAAAWLREQALAGNSGDDADGSAVLLRRVITAQGKSRAWINGSPVTMAQLKDLGQWLVDIHGQHAHQQFLQRHAQRALLDGFVDPGLLGRVAAAHGTLRAAAERLESARVRLASASDRLDLLRFQTAEIAELAPIVGEYAEIATEQTLLAHASEVLMALQAAHETIDCRYRTGPRHRTGPFGTAGGGAARPTDQPPARTPGVRAHPDAGGQRPVAPHGRPCGDQPAAPR